MDQRRLLRPLAQSYRRGQGRPLDVRAPAHRSPRSPRRSPGLPPPRLLAGHGHPPRQAATRRTLGLRQSPLEILVMSMTEAHIVHCERHWDTRAAYVCGHLLTGERQGFFASYENPNDPYPDAWCLACDRIRETYA